MSAKTMNPQAHTLINGITGITASAASVFVTYMEQLDSIFRTLASGVGLIIALITLYNLIRRQRK